MLIKVLPRLYDFDYWYDYTLQGDTAVVHNWWVNNCQSHTGAMFREIAHPSSPSTGSGENAYHPSLFPPPLFQFPFYLTSSLL